MSPPRLLDLFCGAGGAGMGYHRAGFDVVGVDIKPQPRYPFEFHQADALTWPLSGFNAVHASPPCQAFTTASNRWRGKGTVADDHPDLIAQIRDRLQSSGVLWVLENVLGARKEMRNALILHGGQFGLGVQRARLFESSVFMLTHRMPAATGTVGVYGKKPDGRRLNNATTQRAAASLAEGSEAMGIDWMEWSELKEAIPPAYTEWIGRHLMAALGQAAA
jgi:DNA (cytosine-5)-methyltransferase 1